MAGEGLAVNDDRAEPNRILVLAEDCPYPPTSGGRLRTFNILRELSRTTEVYAIFLGDEVPDNVRVLRRFCARAIQVRRQPWERLHFFDRLRNNLLALVRQTSPDVERNRNVRVRRHAERLLASRRINTVLLETTYLAHYGRYLKSKFPSVKIIVDTHNLEYALHRRLAHAARDPLSKARNLIFGRNLYRLESHLYSFADLVTTVSTTEQHMLHEMNHGMVPVEAVPNGVDTDFYSPLPQPPSCAVLIFCGLMSYGPNVDGVTWFATKVLPRIAKTLPTVSLIIVGKNPTIEVQRLSIDPRISVVGEVADVRPYYRESALAIAPLFSAGGTRLKVLEAMALGRVVVSTSIGAEGIDPCPGVLIADTSERFAAMVVSLLARTDLASLGSANVEAARSRHSWEVIGAKMRELVRAPR